ncbi:KamA family radical SAM protein [Halobacteriovorax sp. JY17]|uniref:KamA family radical SAM protein n=1 Tax=Halobacteriovorax sp. JY17 TaxID=2014617 RepID=UPI000C5D86AA|nr:KamA family radical SAM protein [Halobacteriovorax sp. JY17]PIK15011.1 MAG: lysine 2,3-aminomutase [Halobacteriovorax sp. JY17]
MESWQEEFKQSIKSHEALESFFNKSFPKTGYPILIPRSLAQRIREKGLDSPLGRQFLPTHEETSTEGLIDPIGDHHQSPISQIVHRYKNRILFFPTQVCPVICRYCFRKNELSTNDELFKSNFEKVLSYIREHEEIEEIIFSGGDPLILSDEKIQSYLTKFSKISHIKYIRFHTRTPIILPSRITETFCDMIKEFKTKFQQIHLVVHANHRDEFTEENREAIKKLRNHGINLLSQSVLLKDINNSKEDLLALINEFIKLDIRPYYLHHPDQVRGGLHFMLSLEEGRKIYSTLRDELPGWAMPNYIIDIPGGEGKVNAYNPETYHFSGHLLSKNGTKVPYL